MTIIRPYEPTDRDAVYDICVRTGHLGGDARGVYTDPCVLPDIFAGPYLRLEPDLAFVVDDGPTAVGYVLGSSDTAAFARRFRTEWLPQVADRYPLSGAESATPDDAMVRLLHDPDRMVVPGLEGYPAHLHIDLLPSHQRRGHGRALVAAFVEALRHKGVAALHLSMVTQNSNALAFYQRIGMHVIDIPAPDSLTYFGLRV